MPPHRLPYRPDVEGLRGAAILLVVLFHAGVPALAGGFVGVDVFFVLSGFFITGLLARELDETGRIAIGDFWARRGLRLLPPLLLVLVATLGLATWLWAPIDRAAVATSARAAALSTNNLELARNAVNYFGRTGDPLLHTWSLAVEEQFYVVWPLLLLGCALLVRRRAGDDDVVTRRALLAVIAAAGLLSFVASLHLTAAAQPWAFFGMPTRVWEFALGGALALTLPAEWRSRWAPALQIAGLAAIGLAVALYDQATPYPGMAAALPALGAVAMLAGGAAAQDSAVSRALGAGWLRALGRLSYAWYLWHWPLVNLGGVLDRDIGVLGKLAWSAAALVLAWLTHRFIERPAREGKLARSSSGRLSAYALAGTLGVALLAYVATRAAERRAAMPDQRPFAAAREDRMRHGCWAESLADYDGPCTFGDARARTTIVLLGDSHAEHWLGGLDRVGRERGWKIVAMVKGGCPVADSPEAGIRGGNRHRRQQECVEYREAMLRRVVAMRPTAVILSSWDHYVPVTGKPTGWQMPIDAWRVGLRRTYTRLAGAGIPIVAIRGTPRTWFDVPACLSRRAAGLPFAQSCDYDRARSLSRAAIAAQQDAARGLPVGIVDMNDQICATLRCPVVRNGVVVFTDDNHLSASFSRSVAPVLGARIAATLASRGVRLP